MSPSVKKSVYIESIILLTLCHVLNKRQTFELIQNCIIKVCVMNSNKLSRELNIQYLLRANLRPQPIFIKGTVLNLHVHLRV